MPAGMPALPVRIRELGLSRPWVLACLRILRPFRLAFIVLLAAAFGVTGLAQQRPYIGFVYPAGGQQGTTSQVKLGGQGLENVNAAFVSGPGVTAKVLEYHRALGAQEITLLNEQLKELKRSTNAVPTMTDCGLLPPRFTLT